MKSLLVLLSITIVLSGTSCKSKEKSSDNTTTTTNNTKMNNTEKKYRFVVSFFSIGTGIDSDAYNKMEKFIANHPKKPKFDSFVWGREGETDLAFQLKEFSSKEQEKFITEFKAAIGDSDRVRYKENEAPSGKLKKKI